MKKILSTILTLTMLALPFAVQCSAKPAVSSNPDDVVIEINSATDNGDGIVKKAYKGLKGIGKAAIVLAATALGTIGLCMSSEKGEAVYMLKDVSKNVWNGYLYPAATKSFSFVSENLSKLNDSLAKMPVKSDEKGKVTLTLGQWLSENVQKPCENFYIKKVFVKDANGKEWHVEDVCKVLRNCGWAFFLDQKDLENVIESENKELNKYFGTKDEYIFWKKAWEAYQKVLDKKEKSS